MIRFFKFLAIAQTLILLSFGSAIAEEVWDPLEPMNRKIFWFNDQVDTYLLGPVSEGYDYVMPTPVKTGVSNFFSNIKFPIYFVSDVLQLKFIQAASHTGRFLINTTIGVGGFIDIAKNMGLEHHYEDIGVALDYYGIPAGPYLVLPILGPSNFRNAIGTVADTALNPTFYPYYFDNATDAQKYFFSTGANTLDAIQFRASIIDAIQAAKDTSLDYYLFVQSAYYQRRHALLTDGAVSDEVTEYDYGDDELEDSEN
jgi:phospholipid-binding lipoprotein MlaA